MKYKVTIVLISGIFLSVYSCNKATKSVMIPPPPIPVEITPIILPDTVQKAAHSDTVLDKFDVYKTWVIQKKALGPIFIGMDIKATDSILSNFKKQSAVSEDFGYSGGSPAYIYSINNEPIFAIVQTLNNKKVFAIVAISNQLKTDIGIHPKMTVEDFLNIYPKMKFSLDPMNGWETSEDALNQWDFIFITNSKNRIGLYANPDQSTYPTRTSAQNAWIIIR
jgi:hypothetical protein